MIELSKEFEMYRKLEVVLFRYYKIAQFVEYSLRFNVKTKDSFSVILNPKGYDNSSSKSGAIDGTIYVPFNPFYDNKEETQVFLRIFPEEFWNWSTETPADKRKILEEVWKRIHEIKAWIGTAEHTQFSGIKKDSRLITVLEKFVKTGIKEFKYDFEHAIFRNVSKEEIDKFIAIIQNRRRKSGITWLLK